MEIIRMSQKELKRSEIILKFLKGKNRFIRLMRTFVYEDGITSA